MPALKTVTLGSGADHYVFEGFEVTAGASRCIFHQSDDLTLRDLAAQRPVVVKQLEAAYDAWWQEVLPCLENETAVGPAVNPFKKLYWQQFGKDKKD
jgi:hypothetical protein